MGAVKAWVMDIEEEVFDAIGTGKVVTEEVIEKIAKKTGATAEAVKEIYEGVVDEYYGDW